jgi:predicted ATPase
MIYLKDFIFPSQDTEEKFLARLTSTYHRNLYPFRVLPEIGLGRLDFEEPITILYGGNGSGKSTVLNIISRKLHISRTSVYNTAEYIDDYVDMCSYSEDLRWSGEEFNTTGQISGKYDIGEISKVITSDDVFKLMLQERVQREQILVKSRMMQEKATAIKMGRWEDFKFTKSINFENGENYKEYADATKIRRNSVSQYLRDKLGKEENGMSNGENSFVYMSSMINDEGLYILDEPENSLSPEMQLKLSDLLEYMTQYNNCQIIMATHSPFLLSTRGAQIYNLDGCPACISKFEELDAMKMYYRFFASMKDVFEGHTH